MPMLEQFQEPFIIERCVREAWSIFKSIHQHDCYELYYLEEGEIVYYIDDGIYPARKGDFVLIPPGKAHKTLPHRSLAHTRILIYLAPDFLQETAKDYPALYDAFDSVLITTGNRQTSQRLLEGLLKEDAGEKNPVMIRAILTELLVNLERWSRREPAISAERNGAERKVQEIVGYLDKHFKEDVSLGALAERFYMNPTYLSRIFRRGTGMTYSEYLIRCRIREAVFLLNNTDKKIMEIASETGFHSDNHFCKIFRKQMGTSPKQFRKT